MGAVRSALVVAVIAASVIYASGARWQAVFEMSPHELITAGQKVAGAFVRRLQTDVLYQAVAGVVGLVGLLLLAVRVKLGPLDEAYALLKLKKQFAVWKRRAPLDTIDGTDLEFCYAILTRVSRSFAAVIMQLGDELRDAICVFYLVLRALDTIEDTPFALKEKLPILRAFYKYLDEEPGRTFDYGDKDYRLLMERFDRCHRVYKALRPEYQEVIRDITMKMGGGMADFCEHDVNTEADFDLYCHYVAGLVGEGLSRMFFASKLEDEWFGTEEAEKLSDDMGLFLQKVNILRDYREDLDNQDRLFWPRAVWSQYTDQIEAFKDPANEKTGLRCLNRLLADSMKHTVGCLRYMSRIQNQSNFLFCAIPQIMAIATMNELFNNPAVFHRVVKIRRGVTAKLIMDCKDISSVCRIFYKYAKQMRKKVEGTDEEAVHMRRMMDYCIRECEDMAEQDFAISYGVSGLCRNVSDTNEGGEDVDRAASDYVKMFDADDHADRNLNYQTLVNRYYDLATDFYEYGWGQSFHFANRFPTETFHQSLVRHEHFLALQLHLTAKSTVLDMGCGVGGPLRNIARLSGSHVIGVNNNSYQVRRGNFHCRKQNLRSICELRKGNFMELPFENESFDSVYAIEATCHAPDKRGVYGEAFRVLKPGGRFAAYEWCVTPKHDPSNAEHCKIKKNVEVGNGIPNLETFEAVLEALRDVGFNVIEAYDMAVHDRNALPWHEPLSNPSGWAGFRASWFGRALTHAFVWTLETLRFAPKGTTAVSSFLQQGATGLVDGALAGTFTPMYFFVVEKPERRSSPRKKVVPMQSEVPAAVRRSPRRR